jgi:hypothetical protein
MHRVLALSLIVFTVLITSACGGSGSGIANAPPATGTQQPSVHTVSNSASFPRKVDMTGDVEVACPAHEVALGGGYEFRGAAGDNPDTNPPFTYAARASASFPYENGWKIQFAYSMSRNGHVDATAYVRCLVGGLGQLSVYGVDFDLPTGATIVGTTSCPADTTLVGGGFSTHQGVAVTFSSPVLSPTTAWEEQFVNNSGQDFIQGAKVYASCYGLVQSAYANAGTHGTKTGPGNITSYTTLYARCDEGASLTAGGYQRPATVEDVRTDAPNASGVGWDIVVPGDTANSELVAFAECVAFTNAPNVATVTHATASPRLVPTATP